jgi:hypothetical protein
MSQTQIQSGFIGDNAVTTPQIAAGSVTTTQIAAGSVTTAKLDSTVSGALVPIGGIIMWSGVTIPSSWALCNGQTVNGQVTPNLQNKFIVGAGSAYAVAATGGSADATLVSHSHTVTTSSVANGGFFKSFFVSIGRIAPFPPFDVMNSMAQGGVNGDFSDSGVSSVGRGSLDSAGSSATNANLPPYYALAFIMRVS